jgi:gliding motility-associated-like protein
MAALEDALNIPSSEGITHGKAFEFFRMFEARPMANPYISIILAILFPFTLIGQNTMGGKEFWLAFLKNYNSSTRIIIHSEHNTSGQISSPLQGWSVPFSVNAGGRAVITIPNGISIQLNAGTGNKGLHIQAAHDISVFAVNSQTATTDGTAIFPLELLGREYYSITHKGSVFSSPTFVMLVGVEDGTELKITPTVATTQGHSAGIPFTINLNKGETYLITGKDKEDLTGTHVVALQCVPFAMFSGAECIAIVNEGCDHLYQQMVPKSFLGKKYLINPINGQYTYRILAVEENTSVQVDNGPSFLLSAKTYFTKNNEREAVSIVADKPVMVAQILSNNFSVHGSGDPAMAIIPTVEYLTNYTSVVLENMSNNNFHMISLITNINNIHNIYLNNTLIAPPFESFPSNPDYAYKIIPLPQGVYTLRSDSGFIASAIGLGNHDSYFYYTSFIKNTINPAHIILTKDTILCGNAQLEIQAMQNADSYVWSTGATTSSIQATQAGTYWVNATIEGCIRTDTLILNQINLPVIEWLNTSYSFCPTDSLQLTIAEKPENKVYSWSTGSNTHQTTVTQEGYIFISVSNECGTVKDSVQASHQPIPDTKFPPLPVICGNDFIKIEPQSNASGFLWSTGDTLSYIHTNTPGHYWLRASNGSCSTTDTIEVKKLEYPFIKLQEKYEACEGSSIELQSQKRVDGQSYLWQNGDTAITPTVTTEGVYVVEVFNQCGAYQDSTLIKLWPLPKENNLMDTTIYLGTHTRLDGAEANTYHWQPSLGLNCSNCRSPIATPESTTTYYLSTANQWGCIRLDSVTVYVDKNLLVYVPNIFSPNGDGQNDYLFVRGKGIKNMQFVVYNRWGEKVFETSDPSIGWDGTFRGSPLSPAVFVYTLDAVLESGQRVLKNGDVALVR